MVVPYPFKRDGGTDGLTEIVTTRVAPAWVGWGGEQVAWAPRGLRESVARTDQNRAGLAFSYDPAARLTSAERVAGTQSRTFRDLPSRHGFGYDHADNLLSQQAELECAADAVGTPLDGSGRNRPGSVGGVALSWNRAGQLADRGSLHFGYDASGRLISAKTGIDPRPENGADAAGWVGVASYTVDVLGRRVLEHRDSGTIERVWSGWQEIERYDTDGQLQERRTYGLGLDEVVSLELRVGGTLEEYVPIYGSSGHVAMVVRASTGVPVEAYEYSPYGERSVYVNDLSGPAIEQVRVRPDAIWLELSEEVRLEDLEDAITLENLTLGGQELPVEISQPVLEGRNAGRRVAVWADLPDNALEGQPTWPPRPGEQIRLVVEGSGRIDVWGNVGPAGEERTWQWAGGDVVLADTAAPRVLRVCVTVDGRIEIELSEPIDAATLGAISVDGQAVGWTVSSTGYVLTSAPLAAGSRALVIGTALEDLVGTALGEQWSGSVDVVEGEPSLAWAAPWPGAVAGSSVGNVLGFHGLPHDPVTGLVYARNRDYDPEMGRFVQTDPLGYVDSVSLYQYGLNNPVNFSDPTGEAVGFLTLGIDAAFAAYDTYQLATGEIGWGEYGTRMALTGVSVGAELLSAGTGGGLLVKAARLGGRTGKAAKATFNTIRWVNRGDIAYNAAQAGLSGYLAFEEGEFGRAAISAAQVAIAASGMRGHRAAERSRNFTGNAFARNPWTRVREAAREGAKSVRRALSIEDHHLIAKKVWKENPILRQAEQLGVSRDAAWNLQATWGHRGGHVSDYYRAVNDEVNRAFSGVDYKNLSKQQMEAMLSMVAARVSSQIKWGRVPTLARLLNKPHLKMYR